MPIDPIAELGPMSREVRDSTRDGQPSRLLVASRVYDTDQADLWDALTSPARIPRWFLPISGELKLGGRYQFQGNAGGTITACEPPRRVGITWEMGPQVSWVDLVLTPEGNGTRLELRHEAAATPEGQAFWDQYGPGAVGVGWDLGFYGLDQHLKGPAATVPMEQREAWATSPDALAIYRVSSDAWGEASIAAGTPEADARAAAERTRQFYTGETPPG